MFQGEYMHIEQTNAASRDPAGATVELLRPFQRAPYTAPILTTFGAIRDLTAGGSGAAGEDWGWPIGCFFEYPEDRRC
jgi:hypothetical protein